MNKQEILDSNLLTLYKLSQKNHKTNIDSTIEDGDHYSASPRDNSKKKNPVRNRVKNRSSILKNPFNDLINFKDKDKAVKKKTAVEEIPKDYLKAIREIPLQPRSKRSNNLLNQNSEPRKKSGNNLQFSEPQNFGSIIKKKNNTKKSINSNSVSNADDIEYLRQASSNIKDRKFSTGIAKNKKNRASKLDFPSPEEDEDYESEDADVDESIEKAGSISKNKYKAPILSMLEKADREAMEKQNEQQEMNNVFNNLLKPNSLTKRTKIENPINPINIVNNEVNIHKFIDQENAGLSNKTDKLDLDNGQRKMKKKRKSCFLFCCG